MPKVDVLDEKLFHIVGSQFYPEANLFDSDAEHHGKEETVSNTIVLIISIVLKNYTSLNTLCYVFASRQFKQNCRYS